MTIMTQTHNKIRTTLCSLAILLTCLSSCRKLEHELALREQESGIIRAVDISENALVLGRDAARISDTVDVVTKIGLPGADVKILLGGDELNIISRRSALDTLIDQSTFRIRAILPVEHFYLRVPADYPIGATHFSLLVKGEKKLAYAFTIVKPTLLFAGKVVVSAALITPQQKITDEAGQTIYYNPLFLADGPTGKYTSSRVIDVAVDKNTGVLYFLDQVPADTSQGMNSERTVGPIVLRKLEGGTVTTIGGNGNDPNAANIRDKKFSFITSMKIGPDGMIYMAMLDKIPPTAQGALSAFVLHARIVRLDPGTGIMTNLIGNLVKADTLGAIQGLSDGKADTARINAPCAIDFDRQGNLYFLDGTSSDGSSAGLLRVLTTDGIVKTVMGQFTLTQRRVRLSDGTRIYIPAWSLTDPGNHVDGFYAEARLGNMVGLAVAGNGKIYLVENGGGTYIQSIREVNPDTRELSTIIGRAVATSTTSTTGSFKEIDLFGRLVSSIDVDFDGNILYATNDYGGIGGMIYKMDLTAETVSLIAGGGKANEADNLQTPLPGTAAYLYTSRRIVFDQTGQLYEADDIGRAGVTIKKISLQRN